MVPLVEVIAPPVRMLKPVLPDPVPCPVAMILMLPEAVVIPVDAPLMTIALLPVVPMVEAVPVAVTVPVLVAVTAPWD